MEEQTGRAHLPEAEPAPYGLDMSGRPRSEPLGLPPSPYFVTPDGVAGRAREIADELAQRAEFRGLSREYIEDAARRVAEEEAARARGEINSARLPEAAPEQPQPEQPQPEQPQPEQQPEPEPISNAALQATRQTIAELERLAAQASDPAVRQRLLRDAQILRDELEGENKVKLTPWERARRARHPSANDDLITAIRKLGGIDTKRETDWEGRLSHLNKQNRAFGLPGIERPGRGLTLDELAERLVELGFLENYDAHELEEKLWQAETGVKIYSRGVEGEIWERELQEALAARGEDAEPIEVDEWDDILSAAWEDEQTRFQAQDQAQEGDQKGDGYGEAFDLIRSFAEEIDADSTEAILERAAIAGWPENETVRHLLNIIRGSYGKKDTSPTPAGVEGPQGPRGESEGEPGSEGARVPRLVQIDSGVQPEAPASEEVTPPASPVQESEPVAASDTSAEPVAETTEGEQVPVGTPRDMDHTGRPLDKQPIRPGDVFRTASGRVTTPYPKQKSEKYASQWLIDNATAEAESRGDKFNARAFAATTLLKDGYLSDADRDGMLEYLFGQQPPVVPSILKPLSAGGQQEADSGIDAAAAKADTDPTEAQKEAGNYRKGHIRLHGLDISIENPRGSERSGVDRNGKPWTSTMAHHYGYIRRTEGKDGDHIDVFLGPDAENADLPVFVIDQVNPETGRFDEHKVMIGFPNEAAARVGYRSNYAKDWKGLGSITQASMDEFKAWLRDGDTTKPFAKVEKTGAAQQDQAEAANKALRDAAAKAKAAPRQRQTAAGGKAKPKKIEDAGEKLGGARKDKLRDVRVRLENMDDQAIAESTLSQLWPKEEIDKIEDKFEAAMYYAVRSMVPAKPRTSWKVKRWVEQVKEARAMLQVLDEVRKDRLGTEGLLAALRDYNYATGIFADHVEVLVAIDRKDWGRIEKIERSNGGKYIDGKWVDIKYVTVKIDGKPQIFADRSDVKSAITDIKEALSKNKPKDEGLKFSIFWDLRRGEYFIAKTGDKEKHRLKTFASSKEAEDFLENNKDELVALWDAVKNRINVTKADVRGEENAKRIGRDWRNGRDISPQEFIDTFGFRGVEFGNWVGQGRGENERQGLLNEAYDAFMDLSDLLGLPPGAMSLEGTLGIGLGSRGRGWASAHYEPDRIVINLTKTRGAGSLAHEWFHALDNYFQRKRKEDVGKSRSSMYITYNPETYYIEKHSKMRIPESEFIPMSKGEKSPSGRRFIMSRFRPEDWTRVEGVRPEVAKEFAELVKTLNQSPMSKRAAAIDKNKEDGYWSRIIERAARSFETYVIARLADRGYRNDFLANVVSLENFKRDPHRYPYLTPDEQGPVNEAFDRLFSTIETKEAERGIAMFSRSLKPSDNAKIKQGTRPLAGFSVSAVQEFVDAIAANWRNAPRIHVIPDMSKAPDRIQQQDREDRERGAVGEPEGFYYEGEVYLVLHSISPERGESFEAAVFRVLMHEVIGHAGLRGLFGDELNTFLRQIVLLRRKDVEAKAKERKLDSKKPEDLLHAAEEVLADMAQEAPALGLVQKAIEAIRRALRKLYLRLPNSIKERLGGSRFVEWINALTDAEIIRDYIEPARRFIQEGERAASIGERPAFSRSKAGIPETVLVDGVQRPTRNSNGQLIHPTIEGIRNFWRWFGDSKVVDDEGRPLVVYHGTPNGKFSEFKEGSGSYNYDPNNIAGGVAFFTTSRGEAEFYSHGGDSYVRLRGKAKPHIFEVYLKIEKPIRKWGLRSPIHKKELEESGSDGFKLNARGDSNEVWYVPKAPEQIKSVTGNRGTFSPGDANILREPEGPIYSGYEREAGNVPSGERDDSQVSEPTGGDGAGPQLQLIFDLPAEQSAAAEQIRDNFLVRYRQAEVGQVNVGIDRVRSASDAAHILAQFRKHGQETLVLLVLDKDGAPISVIRHTKGGIDQSVAFPLVIVGSVAATPGAASFWLGHNHPSGVVDPSSADMRLTDLVNKALEASGIEMAGHVILGRGRRAMALDSRGEPSGEVDITPAPRRKTVPIAERVIRKQPPFARPQIDGPRSAIQAVRDLGLRNGLMLLDTKNQVVGTVSFAPGEMRALRKSGRVRRVLNSLAETNASAVIIVSESEADARNMARYLNTVHFGDLRVLDSVIRDGSDLRSDMEAGGAKITGSTGTWFQRRRETKAAGVSVDQTQTAGVARFGRHNEAALEERFPTPDGHRRLYHGGHAGITEISADPKMELNIFGGLFASANLSAAASHERGAIYFMDVPEEKIASSFDLGQGDWDVVQGALDSAMSEAFGYDKEYNWREHEDVVISAVLDNKSVFDMDEDEVLSAFVPRGNFDVGGAALEAQRIRGAVAKALGFQAVEMDDEHGTSYLVLPGTPIRQVQQDAAQPAPVFDRRPIGGMALNEAPLSVGGTIDVDGVQRPTTNSNGQLIHPTEEGIRNFWRWFGDSKAVDFVNADTGAPIVSSKEPARAVPKIMYVVVN